MSQVVLQGFERAVAARRPPTRIPVDGQIATAIWLKHLMPDRAWDRFYPWCASHATSACQGHIVKLIELCGALEQMLGPFGD
jgi:hypothetical protein